MGNILVFYPHNPFSPCHGSHQRCIQQLRDLRVEYSVVLASSTATSDTPWPRTPSKLQQLANEHKIAKVVIFEHSLLGSVAKYVHLFFRFAYQVIPLASITKLSSSLRQALLLTWFSLVALKVRPVATVIHYTYWSLLANVLRGGLKVLELHDLLPVNHYLARLVGDLLKDSSPSPRIDTLGPIGYIHSPSQLPPHVVADIAEVARNVNKFDLAWMISEREQSLLRSLGMTSGSEIIYPSISFDTSSKKKYLPPILPIGPNPFNLYSMRQFVAEVVPLLKIHGIPDVEIQVTGRFWADQLPLMPSPLKYYGLVEGYSDRLCQSAFMIAPTSVGTGQQIKIFEALASGTPVIAYRSAVPADVLAENPSIIGVDAPNEFAATISQLLNDKQLLHRYWAMALESAEREAKRRSAFPYCTSLEKALAAYSSQKLRSVGR